MVLVIVCGKMRYISVAYMFYVSLSKHGGKNIVVHFEHWGKAKLLIVQHNIIS